MALFNAEPAAHRRSAEASKIGSGIIGIETITVNYPAGANEATAERRWDFGSGFHDETASILFRPEIEHVVQTTPMAPFERERWKHFTDCGRE